MLSLELAVESPTFKGSRRKPDNINYGLSVYPVLQTADIVFIKPK